MPPSPSRPGVTPLPKGEARGYTGFAITTEKNTRPCEGTLFAKEGRGLKL